jgi:hypothetical protein
MQTNGVQSVGFGIVKQAQGLQPQDTKMGNINMTGFDKSPINKEQSFNFITGIAADNKGVYNPPKAGLLGFGREEASITIMYE